jgi:aminocarboxymuconate-semialdehyde decarboxylase
MTIIDTHSHLASRQWLELLKSHGGPRYDVRPLPGDKLAIFANGHVFALLHPDLFERDKRIADMDGAGVDMALISLTTPGVLWGDEAVSTDAARISNDCLADAAAAHPDRLRWMATLPMQYPEAAAAELRRAHGAGALGALIGANVDGEKLTDPRFAPVWQELDRLALPVTIHPTLPPGAHAMTMEDYHLTAMVGLVFDTTLAIARMIYDGFFDRYPNLKVIVPHSGGTLPYLAARLDNGYRILPACSANIDRAPSEYLSHIYFDDAMSRADAAALAMGVCGADHYLHGSDYPFIPFEQSLQWCEALDADERAAVLGGNAQRLFGL